VYTGAFSHDGTRLAVASNDRTVWLYQLHGRGKPTAIATLRAVNGNVFALAFSPDDGTLVAGGRSPSVAVWTTDASRYAGQLCPSAGAPLTRAEWAQYVPGAAYAPPCR
jgi:WD40 repeat protein